MRLFDIIFGFLPAKKAFWIVVWIVWAVTLYWLSSRSIQVDGPKIPHLDKVLHFGYFACGGFALAYALIQRAHLASHSKFLLCLCIGALVGLLDEYHQSFTPLRSGNDPLDWTADLLGTAAGIFAFLYLSRRSVASLGVK